MADGGEIEIRKVVMEELEEKEEKEDECDGGGA